MNIKEVKTQLRKKLLAQRSAMSEAHRLEAAQIIFDKIKEMECFRRAQNVMIYVSYSTELNTHDFISYCIKAGKTVVTPICNPDRTMFLAVTESFPEGFYETKMGILEKNKEESAALEPEKLDLIITPGISFTPDGKRLGYGGGYYDRLFDKTDALRLCPCYEEMLSEDLPCGQYDKPVDIIVTQEQCIFISPAE